MKQLFADAADDRLKLMDKAAYLDFVPEIIRRPDAHVNSTLDSSHVWPSLFGVAQHAE